MRGRHERDVWIVLECLIRANMQAVILLRGRKQHGRAAAYIVCCVLVAMISSGWLVAEGWQGREEMNTLQTLSYLDGTRFCLIYMDVLDEVLEKVKLTPVHGVARVMSDRLIVEESSGNQLVVPDSALPSITPSDGTVLLKDAEHYVIIKIGVRS